MSHLTEFPEGVVQAIGNYVYRLIDPRNGETFYVGKGVGNRVFAHVNDKVISKSDTDSDPVSLKLSRIKAIRSAGLEVVHVIHRHDIPDTAIYEVEAALIDAFAGLSNVQGGHGSGTKGPMSALELVDKYALPEISEAPKDKLVLLNINRLEDRSSRSAIYLQTQLAWRISKDRAEAADYVLAVVRGVVVGVFVADNWSDATHASFPDRISIFDEMPYRKGFTGKPAPDDVWDRYVGLRGKRIAIDAMKHIQNPVLYWNL